MHWGIELNLITFYYILLTLVNYKDFPLRENKMRLLKLIDSQSIFLLIKETCQAYVLQNRFLNSEILEFNKLRAHDEEILKAQKM